jgi:serine phosphatase RsbU (regulator of sigma subunit)
MEEDYEKEIHHYEKGDILLFYTDGVAEARKESGEFFTLERVESILKSNSNLNAEDLINKIYGELKNFVQDARQNDDITLLAIKGGTLNENA